MYAPVQYPAFKQGTVTASLMLKKLASYPKQNGLAKALREIVRLFRVDWFRDPALRRRVQAGLNKGEARNALARAVFMHRLGEIRERGLENQIFRFPNGVCLQPICRILFASPASQKSSTLFQPGHFHT